MLAPSPPSSRADPRPHRGAAAGTVRVEVTPGEDVLLPVGASVAEVRAALAHLLLRPELARATFHVDGRALPDTHPVGVPPLVGGATLHTAPRQRPRRAADGPHEPSPDTALLHAPAHLAVVAGPDAGTLHPVGPGSAAALGLRVHPRRHHVVVRATRTSRWLGAGARARGPWWTGRPRRWRAGRAVDVDGNVVVLRGPVHAGVPAQRATPPGPGVPEATPDHRARLTSPATWATALAPAAGAVSLAAMSGRPWLALLGLLGPVALLAPRRPDRAERGALPAVLVDPAVLVAGALLDTAAAGTGSGSGSGTGTGTVPGAFSGASATSGPPDHTTVPAVPGRPLGPHLAVVGPSGPVAALARTLVLAAVLAGRDVVVHHPDAASADWAWLRWSGTAARLDVRRDDVPAGTLLVVDLRRPCPATLAATTRTWSRRGDRAVLLLLRSSAQVPAWCATAEVDAAVVRWRPRAAPERVEPAPGIAPHVAEAALRHVSGRPRPGGPTGLPDHVSLTHLLGIDPARALAAATDAWRRPPAGLRTVLGVGPGGPVEVDLTTDGPHALVAGTTGSGKSELLQTLVLGLALRHSPQDVAVALVDFKGGASFGACADLPHVVGRVTDLDADEAARALAGLRTEVHRRERLLAAAGLTRLDTALDTDEGRLTRLVVVVDEFRALADDLPDLLPGLLRIAAQGRSLGIHLVLATQRPAGAVSADVRANVSLRVALRTSDPADSYDTLGVPDAALLETVPGRAILRRGAAAPEPFQAAHAGSAPGDDGVRRAPAWGAAPASGPDAAVPVAEALVAACRAAAAGMPRPRRPWAPPLPHPLRAATLPRDDHEATTARNGPAAGLTAGPTAALALGLVDVVAEQRLDALRWDPASGPLVVAGPPRSGRTTTLRTTVAAHLARPGATAVVLATDHADWADLAGRPDVVVADLREASRGARLLLRSADPRDAAPGGTVPPLVVVDGVERWRAALVACPTGGDSAPLDAVLERPRRLAVAATTPRGLVAGTVVVLGTGDRHDDLLLGMPADLAGRRALPGRGACLTAGRASACQVAQADVVPAGEVRDRGVHGRGPGTGHGGGPGAGGGADAGDAPLLAHRRDPDTSAAPAGVPVPAGQGLLVVGPPSSGRSHALGRLVQGRRVRLVATVDALLARRAGAHGAAVVTRWDDAGVAALTAALTGDGGTVVIDDADTAPAAVRTLVDTAWASRGEAGAAVLALSAGVDALHRTTGALAAPDRVGRLVLVLGAAVGRRTAGADTRWTLDADPAPGAGVLLGAGDAVPVVVVGPDGTRDAPGGQVI
ncbi:FtsK/SpoIIIE domain-containing protein [Luteimicrobium subarcticum]|uniref:FtsK/SpoIIIE domain-containing protein n=1 Tax=Luteimicrobium subarcticum TaxID=620910 RepID=UPI0012FE0144|nr:FtsK/SpoIIIE domain-containing protein [Luteimicrobium subarcticum]